MINEHIFNSHCIIYTIWKIFNKFVFINKPNDTSFAIKDMIKGERFDAVAGALQRFTEEIDL